MEVWLPFADVEVFVTLPQGVKVKLLDEGVPCEGDLGGEELTEEVAGRGPKLWDPYTPAAWVGALPGWAQADSSPAGKEVTVSTEGYKIRVRDGVKGARLAGFILPDPVFGFSGPLTALLRAMTEEGLAELIAAVEEGASPERVARIIESVAQELGVEVLSLIKGAEGGVRAFTGGIDSGWREAVRAYQRVWECRERYVRGSIIASDGGAFSGVWALSLRGLVRLVQKLRDGWVLYLASCERGLGVDAQEYWATVTRGWSASPLAPHIIKLKQLLGKERKKAYLVSGVPSALTKPLALEREDDPSGLAAQLLKGRRVTVTVIRNAVAALF